MAQQIKLFDPSRLYAALLNTGLQQKDPPTYQVIYQLIQSVAKITSGLNAGTTGGGTVVNNNTIQNILGGPILDGVDGLDGIGVPGLQGPQGNTGADGSIGPIGMPGLDGLDAEIALDAIPGPIGATGETGATGSTGPIGMPGLDGLDASESLDAIPGNRGETGSTGATGNTGPIGMPGLDGLDGYDGLDAIPGPQGITGSTGAAGASGVNGPPGMDGIDGRDSGDIFVLQSVSSGGSADNSQEPRVISTNKTIPATTSEVTVGPVTINAGVTVTFADSESRWQIFGGGIDAPLNYEGLASSSITLPFTQNIFAQIGLYFGFNQTFTPTRSGKVLISMVGNVSSANTSAFAVYGMVKSIGIPIPTNGQQFKFDNYGAYNVNRPSVLVTLTSTLRVPFTFEYYIELEPNQTYWVDLIGYGQTINDSLGIDANITILEQP